MHNQEPIVIIRHLDSLRQAQGMPPLQLMDIESKDCQVTNRKFYFNEHPRFLLWIGLISMSVAISLVILPMLWELIQSKIRSTPMSLKLWVSLGVATLGCAIVFVFSHFSVKEIISLPPNIMEYRQILFLDNGRAILLTLVVLIFFGFRPLPIRQCGFVI
ncbi:MAG: hypothetical protein ABJD58_09310 [Cyclobacteriaceae bacterium]